MNDFYIGREAVVITTCTISTVTIDYWIHKHLDSEISESSDS